MCRYDYQPSKMELKNSTNLIITPCKLKRPKTRTQCIYYFLHQLFIYILDAESSTSQDTRQQTYEIKVSYQTL